MSQMPGKAHKPEMDQLSPAQIRVVCEQLLYTMDTEQRRKLMGTFPGLYLMLYPGSGPATVEVFREQLETRSDP